LSANELAEMTALFDKWNASMQPPRREDQRWSGDPRGSEGLRSKNKKKLDEE
jgi:hypothetical protein